MSRLLRSITIVVNLWPILVYGNVAGFDTALYRELLSFPLTNNPFFAKVIAGGKLFSGPGVEDPEQDIGGNTCRTLGNLDCGGKPIYCSGVGVIDCTDPCPGDEDELNTFMAVMEDKDFIKKFPRLHEIRASQAKGQQQGDGDPKKKFLQMLSTCTDFSPETLALIKMGASGGGGGSLFGGEESALQKVDDSAVSGFGDLEYDYDYDYEYDDDEEASENSVADDDVDKDKYMLKDELESQAKSRASRTMADEKMDEQVQMEMQTTVPMDLTMQEMNKTTEVKKNGEGEAVTANMETSTPISMKHKKDGKKESKRKNSGDKNHKQKTDDASMSGKNNTVNDMDMMDKKEKKGTTKKSMEKSTTTESIAKMIEHVYNVTENDDEMKMVNLTIITDGDQNRNETENGKDDMESKDMKDTNKPRKGKVINIQPTESHQKTKKRRRRAVPAHKVGDASRKQSAGDNLLSAKQKDGIRGSGISQNIMETLKIVQQIEELGRKAVETRKEHWLLAHMDPTYIKELASEIKRFKRELEQEMQGTMAGGMQKCRVNNMTCSHFPSKVNCTGIGVGHCGSSAALLAIVFTPKVIVVTVFSVLIVLGVSSTLTYYLFKRKSQSQVGPTEQTKKEEKEKEEEEPSARQPPRLTHRPPVEEDSDSN